MFYLVFDINQILILFFCVLHISHLHFMGATCIINAVCPVGFLLSWHYWSSVVFDAESQNYVLSW